MSLNMAEESNEEKEKLSHQVEDLQSELNVGLIFILAFVTWTYSCDIVTTVQIRNLTWFAAFLSTNRKNLYALYLHDKNLG